MRVPTDYDEQQGLIETDDCTEYTAVGGIHHEWDSNTNLMKHINEIPIEDRNSKQTSLEVVKDNHVLAKECYAEHNEIKDTHN